MFGCPTKHEHFDIRQRWQGHGEIMSILISSNNSIVAAVWYARAVKMQMRCMNLARDNKSSGAVSHGSFR